MARIESISYAPKDHWKIVIDDSIEYHIGITDLHEAGAKVMVRTGSHNGNVIETLTREGDRKDITFTSYALFIGCEVGGNRRTRVAAEVTGDGGAASMSFTAAALTIGAKS